MKKERQIMHIDKYRLLDTLINENKSFAIFRKANDDNLIFILDDEGRNTRTLGDLSEMAKNKGFVVAPFNMSDNTPIVLIEPNIELEGENIIFDFLEEEFAISNVSSEEKRGKLESNLDTYKQAFKSFHKELKQESLEKIVLSQLSNLERNRSFSAGVSFKNAVDKYPNNFIYLCHTPQTGTWLGMTPEMILTGNEDRWNTVALAGTKPLAEKEKAWDSKNILEQEIVIDFVAEQLQAVNADYLQGERKTIQSGKVLHLCSDFSFSLPDNSKIGELLKLLHPTPAVCGFPKEKAMRFILENEGYDRRYYSGFVGYFDKEKDTNLYVNLRCMEIEEKFIKLYAGGGLLASSTLDEEIEEVKNKLETSLSIIHN